MPVVLGSENLKLKKIVIIQQYAYIVAPGLIGCTFGFFANQAITKMMYHENKKLIDFIFIGMVPLYGIFCSYQNKNEIFRSRLAKITFNNEKKF